MKLEVSGKADLALAAVRVLSRTAEPVKSAELAELLDTTPNYVPHVLRPLVRRGWIESDRGPTGGYRLVAKPESISLLEFVEAVDGADDPNRCVLRGVPCPAVDRCALHEPWLRARDALYAELRRTTLAEVTGGST